jgi:Domain of unknown function (DUF2383)
MQPDSPIQPDNKATIAILNAFLRAEIAASESYALAIGKLLPSANRLVLEECASSHNARVLLLTVEVERLGGIPATTPGVSGAFARMQNNGSDVFGELPLINALVEGETSGKDTYELDLTELDVATRKLVEDKLRPEQLRTRATIDALKSTQAH